MEDKDLNPKRTEDNYAPCFTYEDRIVGSKHKDHDDVSFFSIEMGYTILQRWITKEE